MRLLVAIAYLRLSVLESLGILLHKRFNDHDRANGDVTQPLPLQAENNDEEGHGIQGLEKMMFHRWLWFLIPTLPPAIKLASMTGVG
jgi:hypothetical protein